MRLNCESNLTRVFHGKEMTDDLGVVFSLSRQSQSWVKFLGNLTVGHDLNDLCRFRHNEVCRSLRNFSIHQRRLPMEVMEKPIFESRYLVLRGNRICPDPRDLPNINLSIGNNIRTSGGQVPIDARPDSIDGLTNINWHAVEITQCIASDGVGKRPHGASPKIEVNCHLFGSFKVMRDLIYE